MWRRSVYIYRKRGLPFPMLESFDLPDQNISCGARAVSTVPTQALMLMNDEFVVKQAELFAAACARGRAGRSGQAGRTRLSHCGQPLARPAGARHRLSSICRATIWRDSLTCC